MPKSTTEITDHINSSNEWEFSRKTVERDLEAMAFTHGVVESSGHPIGFKIDPNFTKQYHLRLTEEDLQVLALLLTVNSKQSPDFLMPLLKSLDVALSSSLPRNLRQELNRLRKFCVARGIPSGRSKVPDPRKMLVVCEAIRKRQVIEMWYESPYDRTKNKLKRHFAPLALEVFGGSYYLVAEDKDAKEGETKIKRLALARVKEAHLTEAHFETPKDFDLNAWNSAFAGLGGDSPDLTKIGIVCGNHLGTYLTENEIHPSQRIKKSGKKYEVQFEIPVGSPFLRFLAGFAWDIEKLEPKNVADELKELLKSGWEAIAS